MKELRTGKIRTRHNSSGALYPFTPPTTSTSAFLSMTSTLWHSRLGHPTENIIGYLRLNSIISCNKSTNNTHLLCHSCQISKHKRLPFFDSISCTLLPFDIIHCDLWTSPIPSRMGHKYYMVLMDNFTQYVWIYPLKFKSETFERFSQFHSFIYTQFNTKIKSFQCDMGGEFDNTKFKQFASTHGLHFRFSCPQTSPQNGKAERMIRRLNEIILVLLAHALLPPSFLG